jgi:Lon protease-like protein
MEIAIFPLPNVVFFPHTLLPLHIFEPRYRQMLADCLAGEKRLAIVLLRPGWEADYHGRPPVYSVAGAGEILESEMLRDGRSNILLRGLGRITIEEEVPSPKPYRIGRASWLHDVYPPRGEEELAPQTEHLHQICGQLLSELPQPVPGFLEVLTDRDRPGAFIDRVSSLVLQEAEQRQRLLEMSDVKQRLVEVTRHLEALLLRVERGGPRMRVRRN